MNANNIMDSNMEDFYRIMEEDMIIENKNKIRNKMKNKIKRMIEDKQEGISKKRILIDFIEENINEEDKKMFYSEIKGIPEELISTNIMYEPLKTIKKKCAKCYVNKSIDEYKFTRYDKFTKVCKLCLEKRKLLFIKNKMINYKD
jgi:hypothetical protein